MKVTPKPKTQKTESFGQRSDVLKTYNAYWKNYLQGDVKAMARLLDKGYTQIGSAEAEVFFNKKGAIKFLHETIDQVTGKVQMRNRTIKTERHQRFILITELTDLYVLADGDWIFHSRFRASSLMKKDGKNWKFFHQHSSFPDIRAQGGENISIEKISAENLQLRDAVKRRTVELEQKISELRATQTQLIQSEKMASLGELTAGIAHEIQNPLNFVNNFSEVSTELVDEMNDELQKGNTEDARKLAIDLKQNLEKINHHGKRAGDIVKGMLQHSRSSSGVKEPTNINTLADEYLRLAYHGLRAKDKSFNATMKTDFDESIGNINIIPQDIGRVILNLITNAFYAVTEKKKLQSSVQTAGQPGYEPTVSLSTKKADQKVEIRVKDNGNGIAKKVLDKIFQPFFTTKPTGEGTGLGLSMSYDIITKSHQGELRVETKEGEGSEFIIVLPQ